jgi:hypothetical protein
MLIVILYVKEKIIVTKNHLVRFKRGRMIQNIYLKNVKDVVVQRNKEASILTKKARILLQNKSDVIIISFETNDPDGFKNFIPSLIVE